MLYAINYIREVVKRVTKFVPGTVNNAAFSGRRSLPPRLGVKRYDVICLEGSVVGTGSVVVEVGVGLR